jgi:hypothetical protein
VSFEDFIQKSMKGLLGLGFKDFWAYYPTTLLVSNATLDFWLWVRLFAFLTLYSSIIALSFNDANT